MTLANVVAASMFTGITLYALLAGADFGAGFWDLVAGNAERGAPTRRLIEAGLEAKGRTEGPKALRADKSRKGD